MDRKAKMASITTRSASASPSVASISLLDPSNFPLKSIKDVINFFRRALDLNSTHGVEPDLALLSIVAGFIELSLTTGEAAQAAGAAASSMTVPTNNSVIPAMGATNPASANPKEVINGKTIPFPIVTHELVSNLYKKFQSIMAFVEKPKAHQSRPATRDVIKKVSDVIWHSLIRSSYKDRAHLQNMYSYLASNKLDCFGVALAVVAGCQQLGYKDVHLAIAEDHAWCVFGKPNQLESIEVTWHGKGHEDKRGQDVNAGIESNSWLYLSGKAVVCTDRIEEVAAIVAAINTSLTVNSDCVEVEELQRQLLWLLYDRGHLRKYPMALGTLGELEEICPSKLDGPSCEHLYREAIESAKCFYANHHIYPHTYQGNYYNRLGKYRKAFGAWANAADVIRLYTYSCREDEEIYKELVDIANEMIPSIIKTESSGHSARSIIRDPEVFANLLRFYDGICQWEEDSLTPIIHIGWAKPLVNNITKFDYDIRSQVVIKTPEDEYKQRSAESEATAATKEAKFENNSSTVMEGNNNNIRKDERERKSDVPTTLADLTAACGEKILNPEFLLKGGEQPFATDDDQSQQCIQQSLVTSSNSNLSRNATHKEITNGSTSAVSSKSPAATEFYNIDKPTSPNSISCLTEVKLLEQCEDVAPIEFLLKRPVITLYSQKMKGLKDLLLAEKLNTQAINLQVTAQSVASRKIRGIDKSGHHTTQSIYASSNLGTGADLAANNSDSIAATRAKRTRRE